MAFNHNTRWEDNALNKSLSDHGDDLVRALGRVRQTPEVSCNDLTYRVVYEGDTYFFNFRKRADLLFLLVTALVG